MIPIERQAAPDEGRWRLLLAVLTIVAPLVLLASASPIWWR